MWLVLNNSFLSVVALRRTKNMLLVRARQEQDLRNVFPDAAITVTPKRDYAFRTVVSRKAMKQAMAAEIDRIDYDNFKDSVPENARHDAYLDVWTSMLMWSRGAYGPKDE